MAPNEIKMAQMPQSESPDSGLLRQTKLLLRDKDAKVSNYLHHHQLRSTSTLKRFKHKQVTFGL